MKRARLTARARADVDGQAVYSETRRRGYARRFLLAFQKTLRRIERSPTAISLFGFKAPDLLDVRVTTVDQFDNLLVFFRADAGDVQILRVVHGARSMDALADEMPSE